MMMKQSTEDEINDWAVNRYASTAAPSLTAATQPDPAPAATSGMLGTAATPTAIDAPAPAAAATPAATASTWAAAAAPAATAATPAATPSTTSTMAAATTTPATPATAPAAKPYVDINSWYRNELGRNGDAEGMAFWQQALDAGRDPQELYRDFTAAAMKNNENVKPVDWASANNAVALTPAPAPITATNPSGAPQIAKTDIATRTIDKPTETVQGQIGNVLSENSPVLQQARAEAMRSAADRGMLNSAMAASGGEDAVVRSASGIASTDAGAYNNAANYNVAAQNQATMWNADQVAQMQRLEKQQQADTAARSQQLQIAQMQDTTSRYNAEMSANTAKYNTDASYRQQMDSQKQSLANNIIANMDLSPDRKAAMLEALGLGTSASATGSGTGLAGAVYVIGSTAADLQPTSQDYVG